MAQQRRLDVGADAAGALLGRRDQLARAAVRLKAGDVRLAHVADAEHRHVRLAQRHAEGHIGGQDQLALNVQPVDVGRGVRLGIAECLRLREHVGKVDVAAVHRVHDVVGRAVEDAPDAGDVVGARGLFEVRQPRDAAADRRRAPQRRAVLLGERRELVIVPAHEVFVRGHHVLPGAQRGRHVFIRRVQAAHDLHDGVHRRVVENVLHLVGGSGCQLAEIAPAQHPCCADIVPAGEHIVNAPADNAKAQKSDVHDVPSLCFDENCPRIADRCFSSENNIPRAAADCKGARALFPETGKKPAEGTFCRLPLCSFTARCPAASARAARREGKTAPPWCRGRRKGAAASRRPWAARR